jgi:hypothetical protein
MPPVTVLALALLAWLVLSLPVALVLGRTIARATSGRLVDDLEHHPAVDQVAHAGHVARLG